MLSPGDFVESNSTAETSPGNQELNKNKRFSTIEEENEDTSEDTNSSTTDMPALSDFMLTAADILNCKLSAKLVVLSCGHSNDDDEQVNKFFFSFTGLQGYLFFGHEPSQNLWKLILDIKMSLSSQVKTLFIVRKLR